MTDTNDPNATAEFRLTNDDGEDLGVLRVPALMVHLVQTLHHDMHARLGVYAVPQAVPENDDDTTP